MDSLSEEIPFQTCADPQARNQKKSTEQTSVRMKRFKMLRLNSTVFLWKMCKVLSPGLEGGVPPGPRGSGRARAGLQDREGSGGGPACNYGAFRP